MKKLIYLLLVPIFLISCNSSDDSDDSDDFNDNSNIEGSYISASVNGESFLAAPVDSGMFVLNATLTETDFLFAFQITGVEFFSDNSFHGITLAFFGEDFDNIENGFEIINDESIEQDYTFGGYYDLITVDEEEEDFSMETDVGYFKITSIDKIAKVISGEFSYTVTDLISGNTFEITEGVFNELNYTVQ